MAACVYSYFNYFHLPSAGNVELSLKCRKMILCTLTLIGTKPSFKIRKETLLKLHFFEGEGAKNSIAKIRKVIKIFEI